MNFNRSIYLLLLPTGLEITLVTKSGTRLDFAPASRSQQTTLVEYLTSTETTSLNLPFSEAVRFGNLLYFSGAIAEFKSQQSSNCKKCLSCENFHLLPIT